MNEKIINAEQINIVGKDGIPRLSLFNEDNIPNVLFRGEEILKGHRQNDNIAGMLFFNPNGTEAGGLIYGNNKNANGETTAGMSLTFDQFEQDQVLQFLYTKEGKHQQYGIHLYDRSPDKNVKEQAEQLEEALKLTDETEKTNTINDIYAGCGPRAFFGKRNDEVTVELCDEAYKPRLKMYIDKQGNPHIDFLDADGNVTYSLPPKTE